MIQSQRGFSLMELALAMLIISVILISSAAIIDNMHEAQRYRETIAEMRKLRGGLTGHAYEIQTGHQASFGYWGAHRSFPPGPPGDTLDALYEFIQEPQGTAGGLHDLMQDAWGNAYQRIFAGGLFTVQSYGPDRTSGGGDDVNYTIEYNRYRNNTVRVHVTDARGTPLRTAHQGELFREHHIFYFQMAGYGGEGANAPWSTFVATTPGGVGGAPGDMDDMTYHDGYYRVTGVPAGFYRLYVTPTEGFPFGAPNHHGRYNHQEGLAGYYDGGGAPNGEVFINKIIVVYPRGQGVEQIFEVRMPGVIHPGKIGDNTIISA